VAGRLFYPAPPELKAAARPAGWLQPWRWAAARGEPWLPHINYSRGLAKFLFFRLHGWQYDILQQLLVAFSFVFGKAQRLDLSRGAPLAADAPEQLPLVVFSHGLGGTRFL
jgi:predicted dienelactone hydrolase